MAWQVLHVRPRCEKKLATCLQSLQVEHYLPLREVCRIYQRRKVITLKPAFPGYVFAAVSREQRTDVMRTNYIARTIIPEDERRFLYELDQVRSALSVDPTLGTSTAVIKGRYVRIVAGPFQGVEGVVAKMRGTSRIYLNVHILGQAAVVRVDRDYLELLD